MIGELQVLLDRYSTWLRDRTMLRDIEESVEITTPYLDRHNDYLQIYATRTTDGFVLTDDGYILDDLASSGCKTDSPKRRRLLMATLNGFGVGLNENVLEVRASSEDFSLRKHNLVQAMLAVNDLFYLASPTIASLFLEDVTTWLDLMDIRYTPNVKLAGTSGYDHRFHFVIPKSKSHPERVVSAVNRPSRNAAQATMFAWMDTRHTRSPESVAYAFLNDSATPVSESVLTAMRSYEVRPIPWSARAEALPELAS